MISRDDLPDTPDWWPQVPCADCHHWQCRCVLEDEAHIIRGTE